MRKRGIYARLLVGIAMLLQAGLGMDSAMAAKARHGAPLGDPARGMHLYQACMGCHSLDDNDVGPRHRGVVGRAAAVVPGYAYSGALKSAHLLWTPANLDRWLAGPQALVPGAKMYYTVPNPQDRADIIAYLAKQK